MRLTPRRLRARDHVARVLLVVGVLCWLSVEAHAGFLDLLWWRRGRDGDRQPIPTMLFTANPALPGVL
jgi:hypothetical protein